MQRNPGSISSALAARCAGIAAALLVLMLALPASTAFAQAAGGPAWSDLKPSERSVLEPLHSQWSTIDPARKAKWREVAGRYHTLSPDEQQRVRARMADWDGMSASQRVEARSRFKESNQLPASERRARWEAYQSL